MRKFFIILILLVVFIMLFIGVSNNSSKLGVVNASVNNLEENNGRFVFIDAQYESGLHIGRYYDKETKVIYMFTRNGHNAGGLTVMVDANGKPLLYDE